MTGLQKWWAGLYLRWFVLAFHWGGGDPPLIRHGKDAVSDTNPTPVRWRRAALLHFNWRWLQPFKYLLLPRAAVGETDAVERVRLVRVCACQTGVDRLFPPGCNFKCLFVCLFFSTDCVLLSAFRQKKFVHWLISKLWSLHLSKPGSHTCKCQGECVFFFIFLFRLVIISNSSTVSVQYVKCF